MIKKIPLLSEYRFLVNKSFLQDFFLKNNFFKAEKIKIQKIKESSVMMDNALKIFISYQISLNHKEKKSLHAIHRFRGSSLKEFQILNYLWQYPFPEDHFLLPKPLFYFKKEKVLLYEDVPGKPFSGLPKKKILVLLKNIIPSLVDSLIALQKTKPPAETYSLKKDEIKTKEFEKEFLKFLPLHRSLIKKNVSEIFEKKKFYLSKDIPSFFTHSDLTFGNLIWQKNTNSLGLIDFSESCYYDPLADAGTFLGQLDYLDFLFEKKERLLKTLQKKFSKKYINSLKKEFGSKGKSFLDEWQKRLSLHRAWGNLQNAIFVLAAQQKIQNPKGCLWFLKLSNNLLNNEKK